MVIQSFPYRYKKTATAIITKNRQNNGFQLNYYARSKKGNGKRLQSITAEQEQKKQGHSRKTTVKGKQEEQHQSRQT